jgi:exonuclease VII large subunit
VQRQEVHNAFQTTHSELKSALQQSSEQHKIREEMFETARKEKDQKMLALRRAQMRNEEVERNNEATVDEKQAAFQSVVDCMVALDRVGVSAESSKSCREADEYLRHKFSEWKDAYSRKNDEDKRFYDRSKMMALVVGPVITLLSFAGTAAFHYARQHPPVQEQMQTQLSRLEQQHKHHEEVITKMLTQHKTELEQQQLQLRTTSKTASWWNWGSLAAVVGLGTALLGKSFG